MDDRITPKTAIKGFLDNASISKSGIATRSRVRRSSASAVPSTSAALQFKKRKSQSFSELTPRTLIQGVLATTDVAPDTARKRPRLTPPQKKKALTPGTVTRSTRKRIGRLDVLATPGGSNPTPRSLIQGLLNTAPVETPWNPQQVVRRTSPRNKPDFPTVAESLQTKSQVPSLSPFIKDPKSVPRPGGGRLRSGLRRRAIDSDKFAAGIEEKLSQEEAASRESKNYVPETLEEFPSFAESPQQGGDTILESIQEEEEASMSISEEGSKKEEEEDSAAEEEEEEVVEKRDSMRGETKEPADPVFVPVSVDEEAIPSGTDDQSQDDVSGEDTAEQTTIIADGLSVEQTAQSDADGEDSTENDDAAIMPTQPQQAATPRSARKMATQPTSEPRVTTPRSARKMATQPTSELRVATPRSARRMATQQTSEPRVATPRSARRMTTPMSSQRKSALNKLTPRSAQIRTPLPSRTPPSRTSTPVSVLSRTSTPRSSRRSTATLSRSDTPVSSNSPSISRRSSMSAQIRRTPASVRTEVGTPHSIEQNEIDTVSEDITDEDGEVTLPTGQQTSTLRSGHRTAFGKSRSDTALMSRMEGTTLIQTTLDGYSPLVTPRIDATHRMKTPAVTKTPAPPKASTSSQETVTQKPQPKKKPPPRRKPSKDQPVLPASLTKSIFAHFSQARVSKEALAAVVKGSNLFFNRVADDLMAYTEHANRHTIDISDVELLMKRQRLVADKHSMRALIEQYLPLEYRQELIPIARAGNKVTPKMGAI